MCAYSDNTEWEAVVAKVARHNMSTLEWQDEDWPNEVFSEYLSRCMRYQATLQPFKKRRVTFDILKRNVLYATDETKTAVLDDIITWDDLNIFRGGQNPQLYLARTIDRTITEIGFVTLLSYIAQPLYHRNELEHRQLLVRELIGNHEFFNALDTLLADFKKSEDIFLSFWLNDPFRQAAARTYFKIPYFKNVESILNANTHALALKNIVEHKQRILFCVTGVAAAMILPLYAISKACDYSIPLLDRLGDRLVGTGGAGVALLSLVQNKIVQIGAIAGAGLYAGLRAQEDFEWARDNFKLVIYLQEKLHHVALCSAFFASLKKTVGDNVLFKKMVAYHALEELTEEFAVHEPELKKLLALLATETFRDEASIMSHYGKILVAYKLMHEIKQLFEKSLCALGHIDALMSVARLCKEFEHQRVHFSFARFNYASKTPYVMLKEFWNPFIDHNIVVPNSLSLGQAAQGNLIVTGPNAGGKSTLIKAFALNLILAQSLGIVAASDAEITPFRNIITYLNITDDIGSGNSLFKAQIGRAEHLLAKAQGLADHEFGFLAFDEMFNGTDPQVGQALSYSVAQYLGDCNNIITVLATHFPTITTLETQGKFANYKVSASVDTQGEVHYPFTIEPGISHQNVALEMIGKEGFNSDIIKQAKALLESADNPVTFTSLHVH
jgi:DNA mismatch repair ATPase MutS